MMDAYFFYAVGMTPIRIRLFVVAFIALATAISINALYFQEAPRLAGAAMRAPAADRVSAARSSTAALPKADLAEEPAPPTPAKDHVEAPAAETATVDTRDTKKKRQAPPAPPRLVNAIERELAHRGYDPGEIDGEPDIQTRSAIIAYEFDQGMPLTGEATEDILKSLIFATAGPDEEGLAPERFERRGELVAQVQDMLARMGYGGGPADGKLDTRTREAIRKFENDRDLDARGRLTPRVLLEMVIVTGRPFNANS